MGFNRLTKSVLNISGLPDRVQNQASTLKALFDQAGVDIKEALNALMVELEANTAADSIGADVSSVATKTVQAILTAYEGAIADRYTKTEAETLVSTETNNLVVDLDVNLTTGVITVTKKDGTVETFDTALEKVPAKFEIVENNGKYALKVTNLDGTTTQTDVTNLMNIYSFNNSDTVNFVVTGEGNEKIVVATIKDNSIGLEKLSLTVVSTIEGYMNAAKDSANAAKTSETNARTSELNAASYANIATNKATEASTSANAAATKASEASKSAEEASKSAEDARKWAEQAGGAAGDLSGYYTKAETDAKIEEAIGDVDLTDYYKKTETDTKINAAIEAIETTKLVTLNATIPTTGWTTTAPYTVNVTIPDMLNTDIPHITPVYTGTLITDKAIKESWNKVDRAIAKNGSLQVVVFEEVPTTAIPIQIEVVR
jgi:hypothetical protein